MFKNIFLFLFVVSLAVVAVSCDDDMLNGAPVFVNMMEVWNAESSNRRTISGAIFEHDDHDDHNLGCRSCHVNDDGSPIALPADSEIYGVTLENNEAHKYCISCHLTIIDAPKLSTRDCNECHKGNTSPYYSGGNVNLAKNWVNFFPVGTVFNEKKVIFSHFSHKLEQCSTSFCHAGSPNQIYGSWPITPAGLSNRPEATVEDAKTKIHAYCDTCHIRIPTAPNTDGNCSSCHK